MSATSPSPPRRHSRPVIVLALLTLLIAPLAAQLHVLGHAGADTDPSGLPDRHAQLCAECASLVPLLAMVDSAPLLPATVPHFPELILRVDATAPEGLEPRYAFRSRAPPA